MTLKRKESGVTCFCLFQNMARAASQLPLVPAAAEVLSPVEMRSSREPTAAAFRQWMVLPGDVSLVSKIATEQAVYPGQCWLMPGKTLFPKQLSLSQPQSTATQKRRGAPLILFLNIKPVIRRQVEAPAASHLLKFHLKTASGLWTARLLKFCRLPQEADKEVTSRLQIGASGSEDWGNVPS